MSKVVLQKPLLIALYGFPGSGKSYVARQLSDSLQLAHVSADRIRAELFDTPRFDRDENAVVTHLMNYMSEEFLSAGISVVYDTNAARASQRFSLRELARKTKANYLLIWLQIDADSAFARIQRRDRRTQDDRYAMEHTEDSFKEAASLMKNPLNNEDYLVISGKHPFMTQRTAIISRLYQTGQVSSGDIQSSITKPELVNLVPNPKAGRVNLERRNIIIR